jgi:hypothetical protein
MHLASTYWLVTFCFILSLTASAESFQPYEAGAYPIKSRIQTINNIIKAIDARLAAHDISSEEKQLRLNCLKQYSAQKEQLEAGKKISQLPGITYLSEAAENECAKGLPHHSS